MEGRLRTAKRCFAASISCVPPILLVCMAVLTPWTVGHMPDKSVAWKITGFGTLLVVFILLYGIFHARSKHYEPMKSAAIAIKIGMVSGFVGGAVPANMLAEVFDDPLLVPIGLVPPVVLGALLPWWLVRRGRRVLWDPIDQDLIESGEIIVLRARGHRQLALSASGDRVVLERPGSDDFRLAEDLTQVESVTVTKSLNEERRDVTGYGDELTVTPGAAVRIRFTRGEWYFPVDDADNADDVARLLTWRAEEAVALRDEPADEGDEVDEYEEYEAGVEWYARRDRKMSLTVSDWVAMHSERRGASFYQSEDLAEVREVVVTRVGEGQVVDVTGDEDELTVTAGEALLIRFDDVEWLFPIDKADELAALITRRAEHRRATRENEDEDQVV